MSDKYTIDDLQKELTIWITDPNANNKQENPIQYFFGLKIVELTNRIQELENER